MENDLNRTIESLTKEYCLEEKENLKTSLLNSILIKIKNNNNHLLDLLSTAREFFSSSNDLKRNTSLVLILRILERVGNLKLDFIQYKNLLDLSFNKLKDVVVAPTVVKIIYNCLLKIKTNFSSIKTNCEYSKDLKEITEKILYSLSAENFNIPAYTQETRFYCYNIYDFVLENFEDFFLEKINIFLQNILDAIDGEKDPRNILKMFSLIKNINLKFFSYDNPKLISLLEKESKEEFIKSFFDTLEIYYPIEFTQPKHSQEKITAEDLINSLNESFASTDYYMVHLIEVLKGKIFLFIKIEKFDSSSAEGKIEALRTIRKINKSYSRKTINNYIVSLLNLILNEILNNEEELIHIDSLITYKDIIEEFFENLKIQKSENLIITEEELELENNIILNINKIFEKCEGLIFNSETIKNSYDAKDILVIITEYNNNYKLKGLKISIKLISHFLNDNKSYYLRNSNTILFYCLKNFFVEKNLNLEENISTEKNKNTEENFDNTEFNPISSVLLSEKEVNIQILNYFTANSEVLKNLFCSLLKRDFLNGNIEEVIYICELISNFLIKSENLIFSDKEIENVFEFIYNIWKSADEDTENNLSTCIVALTNKFNFLESYKNISLFLTSKIEYLLILLNNSQNNHTEKINYTEINKYLNLFIKFYTIEKISNFIINEYFNFYLKIKKSLLNHFKILNKNIYTNEILKNNYMNKLDQDVEMTMELNEKIFQNIKLKDEDKIYNLIFIIFKNIGLNILKIINQKIFIFNLKKEEEKTGCCKGNKKTKKTVGGCCKTKGNKANNSTCCGGNIEDVSSDSENEGDLIPNEDNNGKKRCEKNVDKICNKKNPELNKILKENSDILFNGVKSLILLNEENQNIDIINFFEIYDFNIFSPSLKIIENYLKSEFIDYNKFSELYELIVKLLKDFNGKFSVVKDIDDKKNHTSDMLKYYMITFDSSSENNFFNKDFYKKIQKFTFLKFILKLNKIILNIQYEDLGFLQKPENKFSKILQDFQVIDTLNEISDKIRFLLNNFLNNKNISEINYINHDLNFEKEYFLKLGNLSLDNILLNKISENSDNNTRFKNLTESEKDNKLIYPKKILFDKFQNFNLNLYNILVNFVKLNKLIYKILGFYYFSLYDFLNSNKINKNKEDYMNLENNEKINANNFIFLIQNKLKDIYEIFLGSFQNIMDLNKNFQNLIDENLEENKKEQILNFQIFGNLDEINKYNNLLNYIILTNDKNVFEILTKFFEKIYSLSTFKNNLETYLNIQCSKETDNKFSILLENKNLCYFYSNFVFFFNHLNNNINFDNLEYHIFNNNDINKNKIKINFLKFNKILFENYFDKNLIHEYLILFKKFSEIEFEFMQVEKITPVTNIKNIDLEKNIISIIEKEGNLITNDKMEILILYKAFVNSSCLLNDNNFYKLVLAKFILNFYLNFDFESLQENIDIILDHTLKFLSEGICLEKSAKNLKILMQYIGKNFFQKKGYNQKNIMENLIKVINLIINFFRF